MAVNVNQYTNVVNQLKLNEFRDEHEKQECLNQMIEIAKGGEEGRISLCRAGICDFICDLARSENSVQWLTRLCTLIGYLGLSDKYRPVLHANDVANIMTRCLESVDQITDKLTIIKATECLYQTKNDAVEFIKAGLIPHLCNALKCVETNEDKKMVSYCIFWISYLAGDKTTALQHGCIELMYEAAESISNKPMQSNIFCDMDYYDITPDKKYPIYSLWKNHFQMYCDETTKQCINAK
jgi:hypothetical protein